MTIEEIKESAKVMEAYANGKKIQIQNYDKTWNDCPSPVFNWGAFKYRVKPEIKYRPFETQEECWNEMHKHSDFGWVRRNLTGELCQISRIFLSTDGLNISLTHNNTIEYSSYQMMHSFKFTDGKPFGIKE